MTSLKMEATEHYFVVVQFVMLHKIVVTLTLWMKSCFCDVVYYALQGGSNFKFASADKMLKLDNSNKNYLGASQLSRLEECRSAERKAASSDPHRTSN